MGQLLRVKSLMLLLGMAGFYSGYQAAYYPGPQVTRTESQRRDDGGVRSSSYWGPDHTYPLRPVTYGFLGFGAVCVVAAAWVHVAEVRVAQRRSGPAGPAEGDGWEPVAVDS